MVLHSREFDELLNLGLLRRQSSQLLPDDNLTIICDLTVRAPEKTVSGKCFKASGDHLIQDLTIAFFNREFSDVQLVCEGQVFNCHKFMLSARSPVFKSMFQLNMTEKKTNKVDIKGLLPDVLGEMLSFMYCGKTPNLELHVEDLLKAADRYQVEPLKAICEEKLCKFVDVENCVSFLALGDMYHADNLKRAALSFIACNRNSVIKTEDSRSRRIS